MPTFKETMNTVADQVEVFNLAKLDKKVMMLAKGFWVASKATARLLKDATVTAMTEPPQSASGSSVRTSTKRANPTHKIRVGYNTLDLLEQAIANAERTLAGMLDHDINSQIGKSIRRARYFLRTAEIAHLEASGPSSVEGFYMLIYSGEPSTSTYMTLEYYHKTQPERCADRAVFRIE